ncbi:unnamed protein product [Rhizophagus irregularis]|nr:unnamed protein product [Rhizophagus irregularis]
MIPSKKPTIEEIIDTLIQWIKFNEALEPSDIFINFPVADIIEKILKFPFPLLYLLVKEACAIMGQIEKGVVTMKYLKIENQ